MRYEDWKRKTDGYANRDRIRLKDRKEREKDLDKFYDDPQVITKTQNDKYRDGWDRIWGKKECSQSD